MHAFIILSRRRFLFSFHIFRQAEKELCITSRGGEIEIKGHKLNEFFIINLCSAAIFGAALQKLVCSVQFSFFRMMNWVIHDSHSKSSFPGLLSTF